MQDGFILQEIWLLRFDFKDLVLNEANSFMSIT